MATDAKVLEGNFGSYCPGCCDDKEHNNAGACGNCRGKDASVEKLCSTCAKDEAKVRFYAAAASHGVRRSFQKNDKGGISYTPDNVRQALAGLEVKPWFDEFGEQAFISREPITDEMLTRLRFEASSRYGVTFPKELWCDVVMDEAHMRRRHPVRAYLAGLEWDGVKRLDEWLITYAGAESSDYVRTVGALVLIAAVRRVRRPGCKFDELLILESGQGLNKSTAIATLAGPWFSDSVPLGADPKTFIENTRGVWIIEAADLHSKSKRDVSQLKASLSRTTDGPVRLAYGRLPVVKSRQSIIIGTTNDGAYLADLTGNRRFWPVGVKRMDLEGLRRDRDQLWAEAAAREASGASIRMPESMWQTAGVEQSKRQVRHPWLDALEHQLGLDKPGKVATESLWDVLRVDVDRRTQDDAETLGRVMHALGFKPGTVAEGKRFFRGYVRGAVRLAGGRPWLLTPPTGGAHDAGLELPFEGGPDA